MLHQRITLPYPWGAFEFFDLLEPVRETDDAWIFRKRLYIADHCYEGGRCLLREGPEQSVPKNISPANPQSDGTTNVIEHMTGS